MKHAFLVISAPLLVAASPPLDEQTRKDLICFAVMTSLAEDGREKGNSELATHANAAASFFLGRITERAPQLDVVKALAEVAAAIGNRPIGDFVPSCIEERQRYLKSVIDGPDGPKRNQGEAVH